MSLPWKECRPSIFGHFQLLPVTQISAYAQSRTKCVNQLEYAAGVDKYIHIICEDGTVCLLDFNVPFGIVFIPDGRFNSMLILDVFIAVILVSHTMHILMNLLRSGIVVWPFRISDKAVCIVMSGYVALATRVSRKELRVSIYIIAKTLSTFNLTYLFSSHVPPRSLFRSYMTSSAFLSCILSLNTTAIMSPE